VPAGLNANLTKQSVDQTVGDVSQAINIALEDVASTQAWLLSYEDDAMVALGYTQEEVNQIKSAFGDLDQLRRIYQGLEALAAAKDFRGFAKLLYGTGFVPGR
jgi:hypothetical protein